MKYHIIIITGGFNINMLTKYVLILIMCCFVGHNAESSSKGKTGAFFQHINKDFCAFNFIKQ